MQITGMCLARNIRALAVCLLAAAVCALAAACGANAESVDRDSPYSPTEIAEVILATEPARPVLYAMTPENPDFAFRLTDAYAVAPEGFEDGVICSPVGFEANEIAVLLFEDGEAAVSAAEALEAYIQGRADTYAGYAPEQSALAESGDVVVSGHCTALLICENGEARSAFLACFDGTPPSLPETPRLAAAPLADDVAATGVTATDTATTGITSEATAVILTSDNADIDSATHGIDTTMPHCGIVANANAREYTSAAASATTSKRSMIPSPASTAASVSKPTEPSASTAAAWAAVPATSTVSPTSAATSSAAAATAASTAEPAVASTSTAAVVTAAVTTQPAAASTSAVSVSAASATPSATVPEPPFTPVPSFSPAPPATPEPSATPEPPSAPAAEEDRYDPAAILNAWHTGDRSSLSDKNLTVLLMCRDVIDREISDEMTAYERELAIHDWIIEWADYDWAEDSQNPDDEPSPDHDNPYGLLVRRKAICSGYSSTFRLFMDMLGIECVTVRGLANMTREEHAWNLVRLDDGEWYCVDVTWDDPFGESGYGDIKSHRYFNVTSQFLRDTLHFWDEESVPECTAVFYGWAQ